MSQIVDDSAAQARLGEHLRRARTDRGWSLTELAESSGVSRAMINRVERGVSSPTATVLGRLSGAFGLTISQLLDGRRVDDAPTFDPAWRLAPSPADSPALDTAGRTPSRETSPRVGSAAGSRPFAAPRDEGSREEGPRDAGALGGAGVERADHARTWRDPDTGYERRSISGPAFPVDVTGVRLPAGERVTYPASAYAFVRHCIWVTDGELELMLGDERVRLAAGDRIELGEPRETTYANPGTVPVEYVVVVSRGR